MDQLKPKGRTLDEFKPLGQGEQQLLDACRNGEAAFLGAATPESATEAKRIRAAFLRFLLLGGDEWSPIHERGVRLRGAFVEGPLDLTDCRIPATVDLADCHFDSVVSAMDAHVAGVLSLRGCKLAESLVADRLHCLATVFLSDGFKAADGVSIGGAAIGGDLDCSGGQFAAKEGDALSADGADVKGDVFLDDGFRATSEVRLLGARIGGVLSCVGGAFEAKEGHALSADGVDIKGSANLRDGFKAKGQVRLFGARIGGPLDCSDGQFEATEGAALSLERADVSGNVFLNGSFNAAGEVRLQGVQIGGSLFCNGGQFQSTKGEALTLDRATVKGSVFLSSGFAAAGTVRLLGAQIGSNLQCSRGQIKVDLGDALCADGVEVKGSVQLTEGFKAVGHVRFVGARIGGDLDCSGGLFETEAGDALSIDRTTMRGALCLVDLPKPLRLDASHADAALLVDELEAWAPGSVLDGFRYAALGGGSPTSGSERRRWLYKQRDDHLGSTGGGATFCPQPWRQLQRVLREMGHTEDSKQIGIAYEDRLRAIGRIGQSPPGTPALLAWLQRVVAQGAHYTFGKLAGYGYRPIRLVGWMVSVWFLCGLAYWWLALPSRSALAPSDPLVFQNHSYEECLPDRPGNPGNWYLCGPLRGEYATFSPLAFSLDVMLPLVDLGQERTWGAFVPTPKEGPLEELLGHFHWGHFARLLIWFETLFGWLSNLLLVAIVSGFSRRNDEG